MKILNNGNVRGIPILATMMNRQREFNPQAFQVFGPKIVASRSRYQDQGLESRFITEEMGTRKLRPEIPINLPAVDQRGSKRAAQQTPAVPLSSAVRNQLDESLIDPGLGTPPQPDTGAAPERRRRPQSAYHLEGGSTGGPIGPRRRTGTVYRGAGARSSGRANADRGRARRVRRRCFCGAGKALRAGIQRPVTDRWVRARSYVNGST